jgi:DNA-binding NarL/FixJ family response regulator
MTSVVLLHADADVAQRLCRTLDELPRFDVIGVARSLPTLRELFAHGLPELLLVDLMLPPSHVRSLLADLRSCSPRPRVLALAVSADDARVLDALRDGADGYFAHAGSTASLLSTIDHLLRGEASMSPAIARALRAHFDAQGWGALAREDRHLLQWTAEGYLVHEVARGLQTSASAIGVRMRELYRQWQHDPCVAAVP